MSAPQGRLGPREPKGAAPPGLRSEERSDERRGKAAPKSAPEASGETTVKTDVLTPARPGPDSRRPAKPARRPRPSWPQPPKSPVRPTSPVRPPGPGRPDRPVGTSAPDRRPAPESGGAGSGGVSPVRRSSFVLLLLGLLGGGLVCLLVVNTTLAANSLQIIKLQKENAVGSEQVQQLEQQVAAARSATTIAKEARRLGLRPDPDLIFIDLRTKKIEAPRGAAAALAARLAVGWPADRPTVTAARSGGKPLAKKRAPGRPGQ